jgi:hypothetical protein
VKPEVEGVRDERRELGKRKLKRENLRQCSVFSDSVLRKEGEGGRLRLET